MAGGNGHHLTERLGAVLNGGNVEDANRNATAELDVEVALLRELEEVERDAADNGLKPLSSGTVRISTGNSDLDPGREFGYSANVTRELRALRKLYSWIRNVAFEPAQSQVALGLWSLFRREWMAECTNRIGRFEDEDAQARRWMTLLGGSRDGHAHVAIMEADALLKTWNTHAAFQLQVNILRQKLGLDAVEKYRTQYKRAKQGQIHAEFNAGELDPYAYNYFLCRVRQFQIQAESTMDSARGIAQRDYSDAKKKLASGLVEVEDMMHELPWGFQTLFEIGQTSMASGKEQRELIMGLNAGMIPFPNDPEKKRSLFGFGPRADDPNAMVNINQLGAGGAE